MWRRLSNWYHELEEEQLAVLAQPERAAQAPAGWRRRFAHKLAEMPALQRKQLRDFSLTYRGRRLHCALAGLALAFSLCAVPLHYALGAERWMVSILAANMFGFSIAAALISAWFDYHRIVREKWKMLLTVLGFAVFGAVLGIGTAMWTRPKPLADVIAKLPHSFALIVGAGLAMLVPLLAISMLRNRQAEAINAGLQREAEQARVARELSESQLRLLRAQIEPHFLFNTLGAVQQLAQHGAPRAAELTGNLIDFLRSSMRDMRSEQVCLSAEFGLVESYLKVMQVRLGERLRFSLQLPRALEPVQLPTMILLTLVENAIKHGIEPALRGGEVTLSAEAIGGAVRIRVQDGGVGMSTLPEPDGGGGTGLDNVRHRLRLAYGDAACLELRDGEPGLIADLSIPLKDACA
ncbi:sensor histidine kinase [Massilia aerilata]|uniref:Sensor histidine kinase n=1 Tax=Massilia aerilata TaxID=453817 RepID=A0ABW0S516_9BURK